MCRAQHTNHVTCTVLFCSQPCGQMLEKRHQHPRFHPWQPDSLSCIVKVAYVAWHLVCYMVFAALFGVQFAAWTVYRMSTCLCMRTTNKSRYILLQSSCGNAQHTNHNKQVSLLIIYHCPRHESCSHWQCPLSLAAHIAAASECCKTSPLCSSSERSLCGHGNSDGSLAGRWSACVVFGRWSNRSKCSCVVNHCT